MKTSQVEYSANRVRKFLRTYAATGSVSAAAQVANIHPAMHRRKLENDPGYREAFDLAQQRLVDTLEMEAYRRALAGSDELLMFLLRAWMPVKYGEHSIVEHSGSVVASETDAISARRAVPRLISIKREQVQ